ncbi:MAG: selenocysteine-specific translation elongation factor [Deltaproteobacteria bacterium]|nr:selenocysteine-specific translation elongation factor [Deltaproteobacteria bacterium]
MPFIIGTAGHVDHGKTTLVRALTGIETDTLEQEKKRGVSIELGFAYMKEGDDVIALIDVPGHERFIRNMLAGTTGIDMALFCVAADDGVMPQTREHLDVLILLGITRAVFVITKVDVVKPSRVEEVSVMIKELTKDTPLKNSIILTTSLKKRNENKKGNIEGETHECHELIDGVEELKKNLFKMMRQSIHPASLEQKLFRLPVDRSFSVKGFGTVLTGTVASGSMKNNEEIFLYPKGDKLRVRGIESHHEKVDLVSSGQRAAINVSGVSAREVKKGDILLSGLLSNSKSLSTSTIDVSLRLLPSMKKKIKNNAVLKLHHMTSVSTVRVRLFEKKETTSGDEVFARIHISDPKLLFRLDKFILRDPSINLTIGGGIVLLPYLNSIKVQRLSRVPFLKLSSTELKDVLFALIETTQGLISVEDAVVNLNTTREALSDLINKGDFTQVGDLIFSAKDYELLALEVVKILSDFHKENPSEVGLPLPGLKEKIFEVVTWAKKTTIEAIFDANFLGKLVDEQKLKAMKSLFSTFTHTPTSERGNTLLEETLIDFLGPTISTKKTDDFLIHISSSPLKNKIKKNDIERTLKKLTERGKIIKLKRDLYISTPAIEVARVKALEFIDANGSIGAAEYRDVLGVGRKLAIEILEYFDSIRFTLRDGERRTLFESIKK